MSTNSSAPYFVLDHVDGEVTMYGEVPWEWRFNGTTFPTDTVSFYAIQVPWAGSLFDPTYQWPVQASFPVDMGFDADVIVQDIVVNLSYALGDDIDVSSLADEAFRYVVFDGFTQEFDIGDFVARSSYDLGLTLDTTGSVLESLVILAELIVLPKDGSTAEIDSYVGFHPFLGTDLEGIFGTDLVDPATSGHDRLSFRGLTSYVIANGKAGNDTVKGGQADDSLSGGLGHDVVYGRFGNDDLQGGAGNDCLFGGVGDDLIKGHKDRDRLLGNLGNDTIKGHEGNDTLSGGSGDDVLEGGAGDDLLRDGYGEDRLVGGLGKDRFRLVADGDFDEVFGFKTGVDTLDLRAWGKDLEIEDLTLVSFLGGVDVTYQDERLLVWFNASVPLGADLTQDDFMFV